MNDDVRRIADVVEKDADGAIRSTLVVARSDIAAVLSEFADVRKIGMSVQKSEDRYILVIEAEVARFYEVGKTSMSD